MSRGLGRVQRAILDVMAEGIGPTEYTLDGDGGHYSDLVQRAVAGRLGWPYPNQTRAAFYRAVASLKRRGLLHVTRSCEPDGRWHKVLRARTK